MAMFSSPREVNEHAARLVAAAVAALLIAALAAHAFWIVPLVALGFMLRVGWGPRFSPLARAAAALSSRLWPPRLVPGPPKRFAQAIGAACTLAATALFLAGAPTPAWGLVAVVLVFAVLESALGFCAGCWLYQRIHAA